MQPSTESTAYLQGSIDFDRQIATLKQLAIFPRKVDFSCFEYHPYLESRLLIQEKWVLLVRLH